MLNFFNRISAALSAAHKSNSGCVKIATVLRFWIFETLNKRQFGIIIFSIIMPYLEPYPTTHRIYIRGLLNSLAKNVFKIRKITFLNIKIFLYFCSSCQWLGPVKLETHHIQRLFDQRFKAVKALGRYYRLPIVLKIWRERIKVRNWR